MSVLENALIALCGPIDNCLDDGVEFRQEIITKIRNAGLNVHFFDPTNKPTGGYQEIGLEKQHARKLRDEGKYQELATFVHGFRSQDLRAVHVSDIVIAYIDTSIHMCGTYDEAFTAEREDKPRYLIVKGGLKKCPFWLFDVFHYDNMFETVDDLVERLVKVNRGEYEFDQSWIKAAMFLKD